MVRKLLHLFRLLAPEAPQEVVDQGAVDEVELQPLDPDLLLHVPDDLFDGRDGAAANLDLQLGPVVQESGVQLLQEEGGILEDAEVLKDKEKVFLMGQSRPLFLYFRLFLIAIADVGIRTMDL